LYPPFRPTAVLTNVELAERVGLSPSPCLRRVNRLEREGYIETYRAMLGRKRVASVSASSSA
jgi:Lrp/AsnC family leucine-responsive transcriptional regulator